MMSCDGRTNFAGLFGLHLVHSPSPQRHSHWMRECRMNAVYLPLPTLDSTAFEAAIPVFCRMPNFLGGNITAPFKMDVVALPGLQHREEVDKTGVANTLYRDAERRWTLANTDVDGISLSLSALNPEGRTIYLVLIGRGATARSVIYSAQLSGNLSGCAVITRDGQGWKGEPLRCSSGLSFDIRFADEERATETGFLPFRSEELVIVVNTTPLGYNDEDHPFARRLLETLQLQGHSVGFFDVVYRETSAVIAARRLGFRHLNGQPFFEEQARLSFALMTGQVSLFSL